MLMRDAHLLISRLLFRNHGRAGAWPAQPFGCAGHTCVDAQNLKAQPHDYSLFITADRQFLFDRDFVKDFFAFFEDDAALFEIGEPKRGEDVRHLSVVHADAALLDKASPLPL